MADEKPLFIPLCRQWFDAFQSGLKTEEFRPAGGRWNPKTCRIGRPVTLSLGYGKHRRLAGVITGFREDPAITQTETWRSIYGDRYASAVAIRIILLPTGSTASSPSGAVGASPRPPQGASAATGRCCPAGLPIVALQATTLRAARWAVGDPPPAG
ncbi:hypothetical protein, partial [Novispirillum itersonii]|uniref:hypothetical protein n=1 Tax=Novispirillum itersonii TaxID=189 RepID=UPI001B7FDD2E